ncbi:hypothetical protein K501DRAFT_331138 [Backusella circina FSU 941]|nr:hypothetical protein K501DRAFT_331138 [Backusella circina FSU 941]
MDELPVELLHRIFIQLPILQNKKCMFVCKKWADIIQTRSLLHTVHINGIGSLNKLMRLLERKPEMGLQLERLTLYGCKEGYFEKEQFFTLFPNLKEITLPPHFGRLFIDRDDTQSLPSFTSHLQHVVDHYQCEWTTNLLRLGLGSRLVTLRLSTSLMDTVYDGLFSELKNMPVLKKLDIAISAVTIDVLQMIHANVPSLETLLLSCVNLLPSAVPRIVEPATNMTCLSIYGREDDVASKSAWFEYIRRKYTHLRQFKYPIDFRNINEEWKDIYGTAYPLLLQSLGSQLTSLALSAGLDRDYHVIKSLDGFGCQIKTLKLDIHNHSRALAILAQTNQIKWIEDFSLSEIPIGEQLDKLKGMERLRSLQLDFENPDPTFSLQDKPVQEAQQIVSRATCNLNTLFRNIPSSVHSLGIQGHYVDYDDERETFPFITQLTLSNLKPLQRIDRFISNCLPHLHSLTLTCLFNYDTTFVLPRHRFSHLEFDYPNYDYSVSLVTSDCREPRYYSEHVYASKYFCIHSNLYLSVPFEETRDGTMVTFVCDAVAKLVMNGREAYLAVDDTKFVI